MNPCACGCGALVAKRFKRGHSGRRPVMERFWEKVDKTDGCWLWTGYTDPEGYGRLSVRGIPELAHRLIYAELVGPIPTGLSLDHLCRVRHCVNPAHLEPVTRGENVKRGNHPNIVAGRAGCCTRGHDMGGRRWCPDCQRDRRAAARLLPDDDDHHLVGPDVRRDPGRGPHRITVAIEDIA